MTQHPEGLKINEMNSPSLPMAAEFPAGSGTGHVCGRTPACAPGSSAPLMFKKKKKKPKKSVFKTSQNLATIAMDTSHRNPCVATATPFPIVPVYPGTATPFIGSDGQRI